VAQLCEELDISRATLYRYVGPDGALRSHAIKALEA
jgi:predicted site-specific integrase-resolvase